MDEETKFPAFPKIPRLRRRVLVAGEIGGTDALVSVSDVGTIRVPRVKP